MNLENKELADDLTLIRSEDPADRIAAIGSFLNSGLKDETIKIVCDMLSDSDKGVRNTAAMALTYCSNPLIPKYIVDLTSSPDIALRNLAGEILIKIGSNAVDPLLKRLEGSNHDNEKFIIDVLGLIGDETASPKILEHLHKSGNDNVILACIEALGNIKCAGCIDEIKKYYDKNELYKPTIVETFGKIGSNKAIDFLIEKYKTEDELTKYSMIESFGLIGSEDTFFFLLSELKQTEGPLLWPLVASIFELKQKFLFDVPYDEKMKNAILQTIYDAEKKYKIPAAHLALDFEDKDLILACLKIYGDDFELDEILKAKFLNNPQLILTKISDIIQRSPKNLKELLLLVREILELAGGNLAHIITDIERRNLSEAFTACLEDPDEEIRWLAAEMLFVSDSNTALLFVDVLLNDSNFWNRMKLIDYLEFFQDPKTNEALKKLINDPEEMIRDKAQLVLSQRSNSKMEQN